LGNNPKGDSPKEKNKYMGNLEIIQERDSEQLDIDQLHQKILDQTRRISNFNPNWCHTTSEGSSGRNGLSSGRKLMSKNNFADTPNSKNSIAENKKLFFESFKNNFSVENSKNELTSKSSREKIKLLINTDSPNSLKYSSKMEVIAEDKNPNDETRDFSKDQSNLIRRFQEKLLESKCICIGIT
jgi:hypothetical protein